MLAILSDLHFCDGTASEKNVAPAAFEIALGKIYEMADQLAASTGKDAALDLVLLGDVFDLLRTERWFEADDGTAVPLSQRPWGSIDALDGAAPSAAVLTRAHAILDRVIADNQDALAVLKAPHPGVKLRRFLLTGNHDRLALHDPTLYAKMRAALGAEDEGAYAGEGISTHRVLKPEYGLIARHGHEWDAWNFEAHRPDALASDYVPSDYLAAPIGDPITTELGARLPYELRLRLADSKTLSPEDKLRVYRRMQRIEDVRPLLASFQWAYYEADRMQGLLGSEKAREVHRALEETVRKVVAEFRALPFYEAWRDKHHHLLHFDFPQMLHTVLEGLSLVKVDTVGKIAPLFEQALGDALGRDRYRTGASREDLRALGTTGPRYVVYGHTHHPVHAAMRATPEVWDTYLNSGTFRKQVFRTEDKKGFIATESLTYLTFFTAEEAAAGWKGKDRAFTAWTGMRSP